MEKQPLNQTKTPNRISPRENGKAPSIPNPACDRRIPEVFMASAACEQLSLTIPFDLELFLLTSQERRIGGAVMEKMVTAWQEWSRHCTASRLHADGRNYLRVWLDEEVERAVDEAWGASPSGGFQLNALAQTLCMATVRAVVPEIVDAGCAPAPRPGPGLKKALAAAGAPYAGDGPALSRRYAVLTPMPFKGGCEICAMRADCPKGNAAGGEAFSVLLPGHEPGDAK